MRPFQLQLMLTRGALPEVLCTPHEYELIGGTDCRRMLCGLQALPSTMKQYALDLPTMACDQEEVSPKHRFRKAWA